MTDLVKHVNEGVRVSEDVSAVIFLNFELYNPVHAGGTITDSDEIIFFRDPDPSTIRGFAIKVKNPDEQKVKAATAFGERTVNYRAGKRLDVVRSKRPKIQRQAAITPQITPTTNAPKQQVFDLDASKLSSLFSGNDLLNKKVANYQSGIVALEEGDLVGAVQRLYQVIENSRLPEAMSYKPLRVACSHDIVSDVNAVKALKNNFKITCTAGKPVDFTDVDNWQQFYQHAHALKQVADDHLRKILP